MTAVFFCIRLCKLYNKRVFKACEARKSGVYLNVNEHFESKRNAENTLLDNLLNYTDDICQLLYS